MEPRVPSGQPDGRRGILPIVLFYSEREQEPEEAFYQFFLFIQIGNYFWNLVFFLGNPNG